MSTTIKHLNDPDNYCSRAWYGMLDAAILATGPAGPGGCRAKVYGTLYHPREGDGPDSGVLEIFDGEGALLWDLYRGGKPFRVCVKIEGDMRPVVVTSIRWIEPTAQVRGVICKFSLAPGIVQQLGQAEQPEPAPGGWRSRPPML